MRPSEFDPHIIFSCKFPSRTQVNYPCSQTESPTVQPMTPEPDVSVLFSYFFQVRLNAWQKCCIDIHISQKRRGKSEGLLQYKAVRGQLHPNFFFNKAVGSRGGLWAIHRVHLARSPSRMQAVLRGCCLLKNVGWGSSWRRLITPSLTYSIWSGKGK